MEGKYKIAQTIQMIIQMNRIIGKKEKACLWPKQGADLPVQLYPNHACVACGPKLEPPWRVTSIPLVDDRSPRSVP